MGRGRVNEQKRVWTVKDFAGELVNVQGKQYVSVGPKLRVLREHFPLAAIRTEVLDGYTQVDGVAVRAIISCGERSATAIGTSTLTGDKGFGDSLFELAETRALARALRFFGIGVDSTGAEEVQGRPPIADRQRDEPAPVSPGDKPSPGQLGELRALVASIKKAGKPVPEYDVPETAQDAANLIERLTTALNAKGGA